MSRVLRFTLMGCGALSILAAILAGAVLVVGVLSSSDDAANSGSPGKAQGQEAITCQVAAPCDLGDSIITITKAETVDSFTTRDGTFKGPFVIVEFDYTYDGQRPGEVAYNWQLEDGQGRIYNYSFEHTKNYVYYTKRTLQGHEMNPGTQRPGAIVFEVAPDAKDFTLRIKGLIRPQADNRAEVAL